MTASTRTLLFAALALAATACGDSAAPGPQPDGAADTSLADLDPPLDGGGDVGPDGATDVVDEEILYVGNPCERDDQCSTGYCYGAATPQGAFEPAECQIGCLQLNDFRRYCDSDRDCCSGRCCLDCGPKEGLCVLAVPSGTEG